MAPGGAPAWSAPLATGLPRRRRPSILEAPVACGLLLALAAAVWGSHVFDGGLYWADDWYHARLYLVPEEHGVLDSYFTWREGAPYGLGFFVNVPWRRSVLIRNEQHCRGWSRAFGHPPIDEPFAR